MKLTPDICDFVTQIVARDVSAGVELARSIGHQMPANFTVGVRFIDDGRLTRVRMRLDDVTHDAIIELPRFDGRISVGVTSRMLNEAWGVIHTEALMLAQVWLDKHPEAALQKEGAVKAIAIIDALAADKELHDRWMASCHERAKHFTYSK